VAAERTSSTYWIECSWVPEPLWEIRRSKKLFPPDAIIFPRFLVIISSCLRLDTLPCDSAIAVSNATLMFYLHFACSQRLIIVYEIIHTGIEACMLQSSWLSELHFLSSSARQTYPLLLLFSTERVEETNNRLSVLSGVSDPKDSRILAGCLCNCWRFQLFIAKRKLPSLPVILR
jgi:hypothetical protein